MMQPDPHITKVAAALASAAPLQWAAFIEGMKNYSNARRDQLVQAALDEMQRSQGRAQQCQLLVALYEDAVKAANRVDERAATTRNSQKP